MKLELKENAAKKLLWIILLTAAALGFLSSCTVQLTQPEFTDGLIIRVEEKTVWTVNYLGYEAPHRISKGDTNIYKVDGFLY